MATWEDGPEYAPLERPAEFSEPTVTPLEDAAATVFLSAGAPVQQPRFDAPTVPVAPLARLVPAEVAVRRNPQQPFEVVSATLAPEPAGPFGNAPVHAAGGAWGAAHWTPPQQAGAQAAGPWGPPVGTPWPAPTTPFPADGPGPQPVGPGGFPAPGSPQWFGPGPAVPPAAPSPVDTGAIVAAMTPGLLITLLLGLLLYPAPFTLCIAFFLTTRMKAAKVAVQRTFLGVLGLLALVAMIGALTNLGSFSDWWSVVRYWAVFLSVVMLVVVPLLVRRELVARDQPRPTWP